MSVTTPQASSPPASPPGSSRTGGKDVALVVNDGPTFDAAAVFTSNRCKANPVLWSEEVVKDGVVRAVVLNSGGANCYTGPDGFQTTHATAEQVAEQLGVGALDVVVCSTGLIGAAQRRGRSCSPGSTRPPPRSSADGGSDAAEAIMTTDTVAKTVVVEGDGWSHRRHGQGRRHARARSSPRCSSCSPPTPSCRPPSVDTALRAATRVTFDRLDSDGCMSTNDTVTLLASGASGVTPRPRRLRRRR